MSDSNTTKNEKSEIEKSLLAALDQGNNADAKEHARELWYARDTHSVECDGTTIVVDKEGFRAYFSVEIDKHGAFPSHVGEATYEIHDQRYYLLEEIEVEPESSDLVDQMNEAVQRVIDARKERRDRRREFRRSVL